MIVTDPFQGPGDIPKPWDGRPPAHYGQQWHRDPDPPYVDQRDFGPPIGGPPPKGPSRRALAGIAAAVVVVLAAVFALWWFSAGPGRSTAAHPVSPTSTPVPTRNNATPPPSVDTPDSAAAYDVGSCFDEQNSTGSGVELNPVPCASADSVFVINAVVPNVSACDGGDGAADYKDHGYEVPDQTANVAYCASLVVPTNECFSLAANQPIERATCGSGPGVVQVLAIESAPSATAACTDKQNPDVWFYQSPDSGQYACVSRPPGTSGITPTTPTSAG